MDSKHFRLLQPFILKGFTTMPQLCPKQIFLLFYTFFQYSKSKILTLSRTGLESYLRNAESLYFQGFQRILPHRCPNVFYTNFINLDRGGFEALHPLLIPLFSRFSGPCPTTVPRNIIHNHTRLETY